MWIVLTLSATVLWSVDNILAALLVTHYEHDARLVLWWTGLGKLVLLVPCIPFLTLGTPWIPWCMAVGFLYVIGSWLYVSRFHSIDVSIVNVTWTLQSVLLSAIGALLFQETWSTTQTIGALCIIGATLLLTKRFGVGSAWKKVVIFIGIGALYVPEELLKKAALIDGASILSIAFWIVLGNAIFSLLLPLFSFTFRKRLHMSLFRSSPGFFTWVLFDALCVIGGTFAVIGAYGHGVFSLTVIASNAQAFIILVIASLLARCAPRWALRELLSPRSVIEKIIGFLTVSIGFVLLGMQ